MTDTVDLYDTVKYSNSTDLWLSCFAKTPHPFNQKDDRQDLESDVLSRLNRTKENPVERDLIDNPFATGDQVAKSETRSSKKKKPKNKKSIIDPTLTDSREQASIREEYTPSQVSAIKRKDTLRKEALGLDQPSTVLPSTTRGVELEGAYRSMKDPVVKETITDIARLDRYKRQKAGTLKPFEQKLPKIKLKEAEELQSKIKATQQQSPEVFSNLKSIYQSVNNTVEQGKPVEKNIPAAYPGDTTAVKPNVVKTLRDRQASGQDVFTPSYVANPPSIAYAADLKKRSPTGNIVDPAVAGLTPEQINKAKARPLNVRYTPTVKGKALKGRINSIDNVANTLDQSLLSPSERLLREGSNVVNNTVQTVDTTARKISDNTRNLLSAAKAKVSNINFPNLLPPAKPVVTPAISPTLTLNQQRALLTNSLNQPSVPSPVSPPLNPVVPKVVPPTVNVTPATPAIPSVIPNTPAAIPQPVVNLPNINSSVSNQPSGLSNNIAAKLSNVPIATPVQEVVAPVAKAVRSKVEAPPVNRLTEITNKWRKLPREQKALGRIGAGLAVSGGLLLGQNAIADSIAKKNQDRELERQQLLYSNQYPVDTRPVARDNNDNINLYT